MNGNCLGEMKSNVGLSHISTSVTEQTSFHTSVDLECQRKPWRVDKKPQYPHVEGCFPSIVILLLKTFWVMSPGYINKQSCSGISQVGNVALTHS